MLLDNELNVEIAEFMLTENGAKVETVNNGLEAVQHFEASEPGTYDVILMDVMMPVMDGLTATLHPQVHKKQDDKDSRHPQAPERPSASHLQSESNLQYPVSASTQLHTAQYLQNQNSS